MGRILLDFLGHNHGGKQGSSQHDAHDGILNLVVNVGNLVNGIILHRCGDWSFYHQIILVVGMAAGVGLTEQHLIGPLTVVHEFLVVSANVPQLCDDTGGFRMASRLGTEGKDLETGDLVANLLHQVSHLVENIDYLSFLGSNGRTKATR